MEPFPVPRLHRKDRPRVGRVKPRGRPNKRHGRTLCPGGPGSRGPDPRQWQGSWGAGKLGRGAGGPRRSRALGTAGGPSDSRVSIACRVAAPSRKVPRPHLCRNRREKKQGPIQGVNIAHNTLRRFPRTWGCHPTISALGAKWVQCWKCHPVAQLVGWKLGFPREIPPSTVQVFTTKYGPASPPAQACSISGAAPPTESCPAPRAHLQDILVSLNCLLPTCRAGPPR